MIDYQLTEPVNEAVDRAFISLIIAVYNAEKHLEQCLLSVFKQSYRNFEVIIIDGGSTDNSISIIKTYQGQIAYWISEPDKGIYDAWNKGLHVAKGEWITFIGADDILYPNAFQEYANHIDEHPNRSKLEFVSSLIELVEEDLSPIRVVGDHWRWDRFKVAMITWHVGCFHSRRLFDKYGLFDVSYQVSGDYEYLLRPRENLVASFIPVVLAQMRNGGVSARRLWRAIDETYRAKVINTGLPKWKASLLRVVDKVRVKLKV